MTMKELALPVYLDNNATTRVDPRVLEAMMPYFAEHYGNAASIQHEFGWKAEAAVEVARKRIASLVGCTPREIIFTSGATESINLALKGAATAYAAKGNHIVTVATEHKAVLDTCGRLARHGFEITLLPTDGEGNVSPDDVRAAITRKTILVSIMAANNETGTIAPLAEIGAICREREVLFHTDATQAIGRIRMNVSEMNIDLLSFSSHKMYGPKGAGALYIRKRNPSIKLTPQIDGGGHEQGLRSGTLNVPAIVGFGEAAAISSGELDREADRLSQLRDRLEATLLNRIDGSRRNGNPNKRLPNTSSITFSGAEADKIMMAMKDVAVSSGSACSTSQPEPSHVLKALGLPEAEAKCTLRFSIGRFNTEQEIDYVIERVREAVESVRQQVQANTTRAVHSDSAGAGGVHELVR